MKCTAIMIQCPYIRYTKNNPPWYRYFKCSRVLARFWSCLFFLVCGVKSDFEMVKLNYSDIFPNKIRPGQNWLDFFNIQVDTASLFAASTWTNIYSKISLLQDFERTSGRDLGRAKSGNTITAQVIFINLCTFG